MIRNMFSRALVGLCLFGVPGAIAACSSSDSGTENQTSGTLTLPLVTNAGGHTYRLYGELYVNGPWNAYLSLGGDDPILTTSLPTGGYSAYLQYWWLERQDENGNYARVEASLISSSWVNFTIYNQASTNISFQFQTPSEAITVGAGNLSVSFGVTEIPPACTILGSDCGEGYWCPPSQLTGARFACVQAGGVGLGEACVSPIDCVANSTCIDNGSGPRCTALCLGADVGADCSSGGTCTAVTSQYGACLPQVTPPGGGGGEGGASGAGGSSGG